MNLNDAKFLEDVSGRYAKPYFAAVHDLLVALITQNRSAAFDARTALENVMRETMGCAEVLGATIMLRAAAAVLADDGPKHFAADRSNLLAFANQPFQTIVPRVTFVEAVEDMVTRAPVTVKDAADRTAKAIARLYERGHVMAFVRAAEDTVTQEAQKFITWAFKEGLGENAAARDLRMSVEAVAKETAPWSEGYARMAFRTNVNTAVVAGRFRQARDPDVKSAVPAFRFDAVGDSDTRDNHAAADGLILSVDNPAWGQIAPPLGYNCRCRVSHVTSYELMRMGRIKDGIVVEGRIPAGAFADAGFRHTAGAPGAIG